MRVSIGLPFFNAASTLTAAIQSVFAQTHDDWELLLVDDGSRDGSLEIAKSVSDPRVSVHSDGVNRGLPYRLNQIAQLARGEYLARMDADDLMHPQRLAAQVVFLDAHPEVDLVDTAIYSMEEGGRFIGVRGCGKFQPTPEATLRSSLLHHPTVMGRPAWFRRNPYDPQYKRSQDRELWSRTIKNTVFARLPRPLYYYREGRVNLANYLRSQSYVRRIIRRYGPELAGWLPTLRQLAASWLKSAVYAALVPLHFSRLLVAARNGRLTAAEQEAGREGLRQIAATGVPGFDPFSSGGQRIFHVMTVPQSLNFISGLPDFLRRRGFDIHVAASEGQSLWDFAAKERVIAHAVPMQRQITPLRDLVAVWRLFRTFRRLRPTIVHAHTPKGGLLGMIAAWATRTPVRIYHVRGLPLMTATGIKRHILRWTEWTSCRLAHQVLCVSRSVADEAVRLGLCPAEKIRVLGSGGNGVDALGKFNRERLPSGTRRRIRAAHDIPEDAPVIGFVGRIVRDKGCVELAEAWQSLRKSFPTSHLLMVGPFEPQDPLPDEVETLLRKDRRVHLTGGVADTSEYYNAMDVLALPTYREGFGSVLVEAAAMELPVVATRIPGCVDSVVDGVTGVLVPPRDAAALAEAIRAYLSDPELRRRHGRAGRQRVLSDFRREEIWRELHELYIDLLQRRGLPTPADRAKAAIPPCPSKRRAA